MNITENHELTRLMLDHLADRYNIKQKRVGIHLSTLIYCLTKQRYDLASPVEPTDAEVMLFALGFGLQDILTPPDATTPILEKDGVTYSPDFVFKMPGYDLGEIKTTRASAKRADTFDFPETWVEYMKGGCYIRDTFTYDLSVLYMMGNYKPPFPIIRSFRFEFTGLELDENWARLMDRKHIFVESIVKNYLLPPFKYNKEWECSYCRYKLICDTVATGGTNDSSTLGT